MDTAALMKKFVRERLQSKQDLDSWLKGYLQVDLANCRVSRFATSNPLDMVWQIYQLCADDTNLYPMDLRYIAGRSSQKTLALAVLQVLLPLHFKRSVVHFGGTLAQANRAYHYFRTFITKEYIRDYLNSEPTQKKTELVVDGDIVTVEILPITQASVQGAHAPAVSLDELSSLAPDKVRAYKDVQGVPSYTPDGKPWFKFGISSRKGAHTVIETEFSESSKTGMKFYFWTVLENTKRCPDNISGTNPLSYYVDISKNEALLEEDFLKLTDSDKSKFEKVHAYDGCFKCPLKVVCAGDLKKQQSTCKTLRPVHSVITEFNLADYQWFLSQMMSLKPSLEGVVFTKFNRNVFLKTPNEIYEIFTGEKCSKELTHLELVRFMLSKGVKSYAGLDHGYSDPLAIVIVFEDSAGNVYIMKVFYERGVDPDRMVEIIKELHAIYEFDFLYPDTAQPALNSMIKKAKVCKVIDNFSKKGEILNGIALIRQKIAPTVGGTKFYGLAGHCDALVEELEKYHYKINSAGEIIEEPADEFNHCIDALRYAAVNVWARNKIFLPEDGGEVNSKVSHNLNISGESDIFKDWMSDKIQSATLGSTKSDEGKSKKRVFWEI